MRRFIQPLSVYAHIKIMIFKRRKPQELHILLFGHHMTTMIGLILEIVMLSLVQPNSRAYFKNTDVKIDDVLTEWEIMKYNLMEGKLKQANTNMNHILLITVRFLFIYEFSLLIDM